MKFFMIYLLPFVFVITICLIKQSKVEKRECLTYEYNQNSNFVSGFLIGTGDTILHTVGVTMMAANKRCVEYKKPKKIKKKKKVFKKQNIKPCDPWADPPYCHMDY